MEFESILIVHDPDFKVDTPAQLEKLYKELGKQTLENPGALIVYNLIPTP